MLHIKTYEGLLDRFKKVNVKKLIESIESKLKKSNKYSRVLNNFYSEVEFVKNTPTAFERGVSKGSIVDNITVKPVISGDLVEIEITRGFKLDKTNGFNSVMYTKTYNVGMKFKGPVENVADKCIELIDNTIERFNRDHKTITDIKVENLLSELEEKKQKFKKQEDTLNEGREKLQDYYKQFFERVDIVTIKDYLYDLSDILGEYEIDKIESTSVGYQIRWTNVDILNFKKSMKVHDFKDYKDSFQTLELIKEFAHRIKFEYDIDVYFDHTGSDIILTLLEELPDDLKVICQQLFAHRAIRKAPRY